MKKFYLLFGFLICAGMLHAQQKVTDASLIRIIKLQDSLRTRLPIEKLYLQTDKPVYAVGDTIWFKGYTFDADYLKYSSRSGLIYIELANDSNEVVFRRMLPAPYGISHGQIAIDGKDIAEGNYTLRAYTNWQRNFGENYIFTKNIYIIGTKEQPWLVNMHARSAIENNKENIYASLAFTEADKKAIQQTDMQLRVRDGNKTLFKGNVQTDAAGAMDINFNLPPKAANNLNLQAEDLKKGDENRKQNIPIILNRPENTDLQFMPEGGSLVAGIPTKVGFKAIGEDGKGTNVTGKIYNSKNEEVAKFASAYKGMGNFSLVPQNNETYTAKITLPNDQIKTYPLPQIKNNGTILNIEESKVSPTGGDLEGAITIRLSATPDQSANTYYLTAQSRGVICYAQPIKFENNTATITVPKSLFPIGIARFSLLSQQGQPLNERIVYIEHNDNLKINIQPDKKTYNARDSVALNIKVTDKNGNPVRGSFSLAITDNEQVLTDTLANSLTTDLLLTSDLKGTVEGPGYYLKNNVESKQALDNLMLTQGWVGYDWKQATAPLQPIKFDAEPEFQIKGKIVNMLNKKVADGNILLSSRVIKWSELAKTGKDGRFVFSNIPVTDSADFFLKAANKNANDMGIGIAVDEIAPALFSKPKYRNVPWYVSGDTLLQRSVSNTNSSRLQEENIKGDHVLKEVEIKDKKVIKYSHNLNGPGEADQTLDEKDIEKVGVETLGELLELKVKGLKVGMFQLKGRISYMIHDTEVGFVVDGINLDRLYGGPKGGTLTMPDYVRYNFMKGYLESLAAKDIIGVEVMTSSVLNTQYDSFSDPYTSNDHSRHPNAQQISTVHNIIKSNLQPLTSYIEITTRNGYGPYIKTSPGTYTFRPMPFIITQEFYKPKYIDKTPGAIKDLRSTIHWAPLVITDKDGKATVSFYASDRPNNYTVVMEGSDMNGNIGSVVQKLGVGKTSP